MHVTNKQCLTLSKKIDAYNKAFAAKFALFCELCQIWCVGGIYQQQSSKGIAISNWFIVTNALLPYFTQNNYSIFCPQVTLFDTEPLKNNS